MDLGTATMYGGAVVGLTGLIARYIPENRRDGILPWVAVVIGVATVVSARLLSGEPVTPADVSVGIALGGSSTGLYAVGKGLVPKKSEEK